MFKKYIYFIIAFFKTKLEKQTNIDISNVKLIDEFGLLSIRHINVFLQMFQPCFNRLLIEEYISYSIRLSNENNKKS